MAAYVPSTPIIIPYCDTGAEVQPPVGPSTTVANQETGFPPLQATPLNAGGIPVQIEEFNGVLNFYSKQVLDQIAGVQRTFDPDFSTKYNGYPAGIILYCESNNSYQLSLVDNNVADFITTPSYIDDGVNWSGLTGEKGAILSVPSGASYIGANIPIIFPTVSYYNTNRTPYNNSTGIFTAPITGTYRITSSMYFTCNGTLPVNASINLNKNSINILGFDINYSIYTDNPIQSNFIDTFVANAGDTIYLNYDNISNGQIEANGPQLVISWGF